MHMMIYNRGSLSKLQLRGYLSICMTWKTAPLSKIKAVFSWPPILLLLVNILDYCYNSK